jgi:YidC/Oxa1 family membrane protein insertase
MLLAIVLSFVVFFVFQSIFGTPTQQQQTKPLSQEATVTPDAAEETRMQPLRETPSLVEPDTVERPVPDRTITVETDLYVAELSEGSGCFTSFSLKDYKEELGPDAARKELIRLPTQAGCTPVVHFFRQGQAPTPRVPGFQTAFPETTLDVSTTEKSLTFIQNAPEGISIQKTYRFHPGTYDIALEVKVGNHTEGYVEDKLAVSLKTFRNETDSSRYVFTGPAALINGELREIDVDDIEEESPYTGTIQWVASEDQYFVSAIVPENTADGGLHLHLSGADILTTSFVDPSGPLPPRTERTLDYTLYFGPKNLDTLKQTSPELARIVDFGFFDIIAKPLLHAMKFIYRYIPNYGVAIILITLVVKLIFWPLSNRSYKSMSQMKRLQPKMAEIRAKYKDDKRMMNQELMNLYKIYKVNPLGGCLPMVLQIPVFFAFYKMLYQAIELRHAPFLLWINDLSAPDRLFRFNVDIPLMAPPYGIPVLTIIMGASMFLQQKMSPPPGDPTQAKMMMFMPVFFTFIFINFPSGLVLYWLVNNILSMAQQYYITKKTA